MLSSCRLQHQDYICHHSLHVHHLALMLVYIIAVDSVRVDRVLKEAKYKHINNEETKNVYLYLECYVALNCELRQFQNIRISFPQSILNDVIDVMAV